MGEEAGMLGRCPGGVLLSTGDRHPGDPLAARSHRSRQLVDVVSPEQRSRMMAGIRGRDTEGELVVRRYLHRAGLRFRVGLRTLPGSPDLTIPMYRAAVFVHGCFWHRHASCRFATTPATRIEFWQAKFAAKCGAGPRGK